MFPQDKIDKASTILSSWARKGKAYAQGITELELKVQEATNEDKWGPHGSAMNEIARAAEDRQNVPLIMGVIYGRFKERYQEWRLCYKALLLSEFLIKKGPMSIVDEMVKEIWQFRQLQQFTFRDQDKRDQGINVRQRASEIVNLLSNRDRMLEERQKARQTADKYRGLSSSDIAPGAGSSSYSSSRYSTSGFSSSGGGYGRSDVAGYSSAGAGTSSTCLKSPPPLDEDPFEATRRRIEHLRANNASSSQFLERASSQPFSEQFSPVPGSINMDVSTNLFPESSKAGPKKLSEVKVNPAIAAAFNGLTVKPSPSKQGTSNLAGNSAAPTPPPSAIDLLSVLDDPAPAPQPSTSQPQPQHKPNLLGGFDDLMGPSPAPATPLQKQPAAVDDAWGEMLGPVPALSGTDASIAAPVADPLDPFATLSLGGSVAPQPDLSTEFAPFVGAPSKPVVNDPFNSIARPSGPQPMYGAMNGASIGGVQGALSAMPPPPRRDPFADLLN